jgi:DNA polymerase III subunit gamma/tau
VSYQVLARKWRPLRFDEVAGQSHVTTPLRNAIKAGRVPHAILLTGPRGVGKTTLARLLARCLNCDQGPTDEPCGECPACTEILAGTSTDVQEIDAASRTSVDDVREIIESIRYAPAPGKHRIFVVDEVHMLSTPAFNALLKTLEEPPPASLFVFATTNPEKIPYTVVSRCQRHDLRRIPTAEVAARLGEVAAAEGIRISPLSLLALARAGEGSLRDALTLFDQLIAVGGTEVDDARVAAVLDLIDRRVLLAIAEACVEGDAAAALTAARRAWDAGIDARRLGAALLGLVRDLVVLRVAPGEKELVEGSDAELAALRELAGRAEEARLRRMFRALLREQEDLAWAPDPFAVLEMAIVRLATLPSGDEVAALLARIDALERRLRGTPAPEGDPGASGPTRGGSARGASRRHEAGAARAAEPEAEAARETPAPALGDTRALPSADRPLIGAGETAAYVFGEAPLPVVFDRLCALARERDRALESALEGGCIAERAEGRLRVALPTGIAVRRLEARRPEIEALAARVCGGPVRLELTGPAGPTEAAAQPPARPAADPQGARRQRQEALEHPAVNDALAVLGAEIVEIRPLGGSAP